MPVIVLIIIIVLPKRSLKTDKKVYVPTDNYLLWKLLITIGMGLVLCILLCVQVGIKLSIELIAQRTDTIDRKEEMTNLQADNSAEM